LAKYVAYYRVRSGPGHRRDAALLAQSEAVASFVGSGDTLVAEFTEDEGPHQRRRPHFEEAIKRHHATLVIPRFRPVHRSAVYVGRLRDQDVDFVALDMPEASRAMIVPIAAAAVEHRRTVSERIRASLLAAKSRGTQLGNPDIALARPKAVKAAREKAQKSRLALRSEVLRLRNEGRSLRAIADELNSRNIPTARGREWHASSVRKIFAEANGPSA
jgi:DNA invertase Pin-like site-specific DNA recombinase